MILDFISYTLAGFLWGLFWRNPIISVVVIYIFQAALYFGFGLAATGYTALEFWLYAPLLFMLATLLGWGFSFVFHCRYFYKRLSVGAEPFFLKLLLQFIVLHLVLLFNDLILPWSGLGLIIMYLCLIGLFYFVNRHDHVWLRIDDTSRDPRPYFSNTAALFYIEWAIIFVAPIILYTLLAWLIPTFWFFWTCLITLGMMLGLILLCWIFYCSGIMPIDKCDKNCRDIKELTPFVWLYQ